VNKTPLVCETAFCPVIVRLWS